VSAVVSTRQLSTGWIAGTQRRRELVLGAVALALSLGLARLVLAMNLGALAALIIPAVLVAVVMRPRYGLYVLFGVDLTFDGLTQDPLQWPGHFATFSLQTTLNLNGGILIPFEMLLLLVGFVWLGQALMRRKIDFRPGAFGWPALVFGLALIFGVVKGLLTGANPNYSFWESRFLFGLLLAYVLAANTIRTRGHVRMLTTLMFVGVSLAALEGLYRKYVLINAGLLGDLQEEWYSHEDVVVWGLLVMLVVAQRVFGSGPRWQRWAGPALAGTAILAMLVSQRRAGLIAVMIAFALLTLALWKAKRKAFWIIAIPSVLVIGVYLPLFWNNPGTLGQAARAVRSINTPDQRDAASNAWRELEAINVRATIASDPLFGIGFGKPFLQIATVPDISFFEFWDYEAHHDILWVWMKTGAIGFIAFFALMLGAIARSIWLAKTLSDPDLRTFALVAMTCVVMTLVYCYVDLGLTFNRLPMILGITLGTVGVLDRIKV
jgi:O-antigen ligase